MFFRPTHRITKDVVIVSPEFIVDSEDIMVRGGAFYAFWNEETDIWDRNESHLPGYIDRALYRYADMTSGPCNVQTCSTFNSNVWRTYRSYIQSLPDRWTPLDSKVTFLGDESRKTDYVSKTVPYAISDTPCPNYDKLMSTLYNPADRERLEWGIGAALSGHNLDVQKMFVIYGKPGSGKSTVLDILYKLFEGYSSPIDVTQIVSGSRAFALDSLGSNPVIAIQPEVDLSRVRINETLNSIVAHDTILIEQKFKRPFEIRPQALLFLATNKPVQITDAWSGFIRRLVVIEPSGRLLPRDEYENVRRNVLYELGSIAKHCIDLYETLGRSYLDTYRPQDMVDRTDYFRTFVMDNVEYFRDTPYVLLNDAYKLYRRYAEENGYHYIMNSLNFRAELEKYYDYFSADTTIDGKRVKSVYRGFINERMSLEGMGKKKSLELYKQPSLLDDVLKDCPAQYANVSGTPIRSWDTTTTILSDIDTTRTHYVRPPINHIVIDFDLKGADGKKSRNKNLAAAESFPTTYTEVSNGGEGLHLHYIYEGDIAKLSSLYSEGIEIKVFKGKSALRRRVSLCNSEPVTTISSGLPLKGEKPMIDKNHILKERQIRALIVRALRKEIHPNTKPSIDFIAHILDEAYYGPEPYDVADLQSNVIAFAAQSSNNASYCLEQVAKMHFKSEEMLPATKQSNENDIEEKDLVFFDTEVFPNVLILCWKQKGEAKVHSICNPDTRFLENFFKTPLVGFNNRRYDNHILYARYLGYDNAALYNLSQKLVGKRNDDAMFLEAYNISYTDVYDFASATNKKGLKKWEIELHIHHQENEFPWDKPVAEEDWPTVIDYCSNDVRATEAVFDHIHSDFVARKILAMMAGLTPNHTTNQLTTRIIFGTDKNPQDKLVYTDLSTEFPGYKFENGKSYYRGYEVGEGGFVYAEPGYYEDIPCFDVASMHPHSLMALNYLGPYTKNFKALVDGRLAIKHKDMTKLREIVGDDVMAYLEKAKLNLKDLSNALKTAINSVYGLTAAHFANPFRHPDNIDNIVAKRGALFMIDVMEACKEAGIQVVHVKTDSIKVPENKQAEELIISMGKKYGYEFEVEDVYIKFCLVNKAVYIGYNREDGWSPTGAQFAHPYVFKTLFSGEPLDIWDYGETKSVQTALYLYNGTDYEFVGRTGSFVPVVGDIGRELVVKRDDKYNAVSGTKGYKWVPTEWVVEHPEIELDMRYYDALIDAAKETIEKFVPFDTLVSNIPF